MAPDLPDSERTGELTSAIEEKAGAIGDGGCEHARGRKRAAKRELLSGQIAFGFLENGSRSPTADPEALAMVGWLRPLTIGVENCALTAIIDGSLSNR